MRVLARRDSFVQVHFHWDSRAVEGFADCPNGVAAAMDHDIARLKIVSHPHILGAESARPHLETNQRALVGTGVVVASGVNLKRPGFAGGSIS